MRAALLLAVTASLILSGLTRRAQAQTPTAELWQSSMPASATDAKRWAEEGRSLYEAGEYKEAAASFERALQLHVVRPQDAALNVARSYARLNNRKQAFRWIAQAVSLGLEDVHLLYEDPAFARFRQDLLEVGEATRPPLLRAPIQDRSSRLLLNF